MAASILNHLEGTNQLIEVGMNEVDILLPDSGKSAIGTQNLNGCTSIVVLGQAVILAHISPMPTAGTKSAEEHYTEWLATIDHMYAEHRELFPSHTTTWGIFARYKGEPMQHIVTQVSDHLSQKGLSVQPAFYNVARADTRVAPAGELVAVVRPKGTELYLENRMLEAKPQPKIRSAATTSKSAAPHTVAASTHTAQTISLSRVWQGYRVAASSDVAGNVEIHCLVAGKQSKLRIRWDDQGNGQIFDSAANVWAPTAVRAEGVFLYLRPQWILLGKPKEI